MKHYVTAESFGAEIPENWEEIARYLNEVIDDLGIAEDANEVNDLWDRYWAGEVRWYAVQRNPEDDWSTGSYDLERAKKIARKQRAEYPDTLIAVIDNHTNNPVCESEIREF